MLVGNIESVGDRDNSGRRQQGRQGAEAAGGSKGVGVWGVSGVGDGSGEPLFGVFLESGTVAVSGAEEASLYLWFFPGSMGGGVGVGSAVKWPSAVRVLALSGTNVGVSKGVGVRTAAARATAVG